MTNNTKLAVSQNWTPEEREQLVGAMKSRLAALEAEEQEWRKTILWEAPCYQENRRKRDELEQLIHFATNSSASFLEANRQNFSDYLQ